MGCGDSEDIGVKKSGSAQATVENAILGNPIAAKTSDGFPSFFEARSRSAQADLELTP